jgi:hypothetical protein
MPSGTKKPATAKWQAFFVLAPKQAFWLTGRLWGCFVYIG